MRFVYSISAAALLASVSTVSMAQVTTAGSASTAASVSNPRSSSSASFGTDVRALAQAHENDATHHGIGTVVRANAHAKARHDAHVANHPKATETAEAAKTRRASRPSATQVNSTASFGTDVRTLAHSHENDATHHGIGTIVSAKAKGRTKDAKHLSDQTDATETADANRASETSVDAKGRHEAARDGALGVAAAKSANIEMVGHKGAVADLRSSVRSEVGETRSNVAATRSDVSSTRAEVAATRSDVSSTRAEVAATVANAKAVRETVKAARPGH